MWHRDTKWESAFGKIALIDSLKGGLPQNSNLWKKKAITAKHNQAKCSKIRYGCHLKWIGQFRQYLKTFTCSSNISEERLTLSFSIQLSPISVLFESIQTIHLGIFSRQFCFMYRWIELGFIKYIYYLGKDHHQKKG